MDIFKNIKNVIIFKLIKVLLIRIILSKFYDKFYLDFMKNFI
jgi:hypothetical protein